MILLGFLLACGGDRTEDILALTGDADAGASVYTSECAGCHGADGEGGVGPAMTTVVPAHTDAQFVDVVLVGVGEMPAHDYMDDQEIADVLAYSRATFE